MKKLLLIAALAFIMPCIAQNASLSQIKEQIKKGELNSAQKSIDSLKKGNSKKIELQRLSDTIKLIRADFYLTKANIIASFKRTYPEIEISEQKLKAWEESDILEYKIIDGEKRYFYNSVNNVVRTDKPLVEIKNTKLSRVGSNMSKIISENIAKVNALNPKGNGELVAPVTMLVSYKITLKPNVVPAGDTIFVWLPFPRRDVPRQKNVELVSTNFTDYIISEDKDTHGSLFTKVISTGSQATEIKLSFKFTSYNQKFDLSKLKAKPYNTNSELYKKYTAPELPHLSFSAEKVALANKIVGDEKNPIKKAELIWNYIRNNYTWASAINYGLIEDIPTYVMANGKGDCGQVSLLFINLCRIVGVPARWQSGWMMHPNEVNFHDWAEAYFEGLSWVPVDQSFSEKDKYGNQESLSLYYFGGIDAYRLYMNSGYSAEFNPPKNHLRIDEIDFQRGELETKDAMISHKDYSFSMNVEYL